METDTRPCHAPTGPGRYRLRNGEEVEIRKAVPGDNLDKEWRWIRTQRGMFLNSNPAWRRDGSFDGRDDPEEHPGDIIAPADAPATHHNHTAEALKDLVAIVKETTAPVRLTSHGREYIQLGTPEFEAAACEEVTRLAGEGRLRMDSSAIRGLGLCCIGDGVFDVDAGAVFAIKPTPTPLTIPPDVNEAQRQELVEWAAKNGRTTA